MIPPKPVVEIFFGVFGDFPAVTLLRFGVYGGCITPLPDARQDNMVGDSGNVSARPLVELLL